MRIYNIDGVEIPTRENIDSFIDNTDIDYAFDSATNANYIVVRVYKQKIDGTIQHPFVYAPNGSDVALQSTLDMNADKKFCMAINAGIFHVSGASNQKPRGLLIQNMEKIIAVSAGTDFVVKPLTIDLNGNLGSVSDDADADTIIANGVVSAVCGFGPIIENYEAIDATYIPNYSMQAQRQIIGQFGNGDYAIVTCEGRNYDNSDGWTIPETQTVCRKIGLKFAYNLDGGGSTETVIGNKQINAVYENETGRRVPTFIVFNGSDEFYVPNEQ